MTSWLMIRRLRGPAFLLLIGIMALLQEWADFGFFRSWPLLLILAGLFSLAERAALSRASLEGYDPITGQPLPGYPGGQPQPYPSSTGSPIYGDPGTSIVPATGSPVSPANDPEGRL
jgi:hypothetical protein